MGIYLSEHHNEIESTERENIQRFHSFPESVKGFQDAGKVSKLKNGDGVVRDQFVIPGGYFGRDGNFTFYKRA